MSCLIFHSWQGKCLCTKCGKKRDEGHQWDWGKCKICGKIDKDTVDALLIEATRTRDTEKVKLLLSRGGTPNATTQEMMFHDEVERLIRSLNDSELNRREAAAHLLSRKGELVLEPLIHAMKRRTAWYTLRFGLNAMIKMGQLAVAPLITLVESDDRDVDTELKQRAASALSEIGDPRAVPVLLKTLYQDGWVGWSGGFIGEDWHYGAAALGEMGNLARDQLLEVAHGSDETATKWAKWALEKFKYKFK
ncbi:MAG: hypothetical protein A4E65_00030 [Syntrophorhabdus sp. PtaU1.Bin153]|nr:MAG: hypothetical protein A4E65_00030 [Syntrophorhabdus sp. PtaU1.Bin153]